MDETTPQESQEFRGRGWWEELSIPKIIEYEVYECQSQIKLIQGSNYFSNFMDGRDPQWRPKTIAIYKAEIEELRKLDPLSATPQQIAEIRTRFHEQREAIVPKKV